MEINIKETKPWLKEIAVTIESEKVKKKVEEITSSYAHNAQVPGFRKGNVPRPVLQRRYGASFESMAMEDLFDEAYKDIIKQHNFKPVTQPKITDYNLSDDKILKFDLSFEIIPDFELKNYVGIKIKKQEPVGFDEEFERRIASLQERCATFTTLNRNAENNDFILTDYEIYENDKPAAKKQTGVMIQIGSDKNQEEINKTLIGVKSGDEKTVSITFPAEYPDKDFANRTLVYKFLVRDVKERKLPEIDDTLASDLGFKDLNELRTQINEDIKQDRARIVDDDLRNQIYRYLITEHKIEPPQTFIDLTFREILNENNLKDSEEAKSKLLPHAQERAKFDIIITHIAEKESIEATAEDIDKELEKFSAAGIDKEKIDMLRSSSVLISRIIKNKTMDWLMEKAIIS
jgi:trigger factor